MKFARTRLGVCGHTRDKQTFAYMYMYVVSTLHHLSLSMVLGMRMFAQLSRTQEAVTGMRQSIWRAA